MDYAAWKLFIDAVELGSLSKTATAYGTTQPHISRQISALEKECGGRLFQRTGRGVVLTELGQRIEGRVRAWLASTDQLANDIRTASGTPIGTVRLGILPSTAHPLVSTVTAQVRQHYPLVRLAIREGQGAQLETWLEEGSVDLALLYRQGQTPAPSDISLVESPTYLVSRDDDPLTAAATVPFDRLDGLPLVLFCRPSKWRDRLEDVARQRGISLHVALEADSLGLQAAVIDDGQTYGLLGPYALAAARKTLPVRGARVINPRIHRHIVLAMSPHGETTLACKTVMRTLREVVQALGDGILVDAGMGAGVGGTR